MDISTVAYIIYFIYFTLLLVTIHWVIGIWYYSKKNYPTEAESLETYKAMLRQHKEMKRKEHEQKMADLGVNKDLYDIDSI